MRAQKETRQDNLADGTRLAVIYVTVSDLASRKGSSSGVYVARGDCGHRVPGCAASFVGGRRVRVIVIRGGMTDKER